MSWILLAVVAHVLNALVFVIDKGLLGKTESSVSRPAWYAAYSGLVAAGAGVLLLYQFAVPTWPIVLWSLVAGLLWMAALWLFFVALKYGEPSRVVPLVGSSVPVITLILAVLFLNEQLVEQQLLAITLLVGGGMLLSLKLGDGTPLWKLGGLTAVASGAAFAGHFAVTKYIYTLPAPFMALFAYVRIGVGVWALLLLLVLWQRRPEKRPAPAKAQWVVGGIAAAFVISKVVGMVALLLQNYAIAIGSVSVVNALQGTQYFFVLVLALLFSRWAPKFFREEISRVALVQKIIGIAGITVGLGLLVW